MCCTCWIHMCVSVLMAPYSDIYRIISNIGAPKNNSNSKRRFVLERKKFRNGQRALQLGWRLTRTIRAE